MSKENRQTPDIQKDSKLHNVQYMSDMYKDWFLDYASYVILERAVPYVYDGLKPVQRRILHAMKRLDDGRYNKVANIIGYTMQYHPHGDASIGDALVQLGQKDLLIDMQGNWGNTSTGDRAAAARYIEARLSKFALEVVFNPKTTTWKLSYDGRNNEPVTLPVKFPLLLAQGGEGIAVGLASKVLPHNFVELIDACIAHLQDKDFVLLPDFPTGGMADFSRYNDGLRGGKVRVRAKISKKDAKTLVISELPFGKNTSTLIDSILSANEKGKIKIKKVDDNTAAQVEIQVYLPTGVSPDKTIDALYAFTDCEVNISPNTCVIEDDTPRFLGVSQILQISAQNTKNLLKLELQIRLNELNDAWHLSSLEKIFIENRIYILIEECETWEAVLETIDKGLEPFKPLLQREVTRDDIVRLTEIKIKRISKYDAFRADEYIKSIENQIDEVNYHLAHIIQYTIDYYRRIKNKYGKGRERKTEIRDFDVIEASKVVIKNQKFYVNRAEGFMGTGLKKDEFLFDCSDIDDVIVFRPDGTYFVTKVASKTFIGKNPLHVGLFKKNDTRMVYNVIYRDGKSGACYKKRFVVKAVTRDREYNLTKGTKHSRVMYFSANPNGEAEVVRVTLKPRARLKKLYIEMDFSELAIKSRAALGNLLTKHGVHKIAIKEKGISTLGGRKIYFDPSILRINDQKRGEFLGEFFGGDKILVITKDGEFILTSFELSNHYPENMLRIEKFKPEKVFSAVYYDGLLKFYYLKRFPIENTSRELNFIGEHKNSKLIELTDVKFPRIELIFGGKHSHRPNDIIDVASFIGVKSYKARGKRLSTYNLKSIKMLEPLIKEETVIKFKEEELEKERQPMQKDENTVQTKIEF